MATLAQYFAALERERNLPPGLLARMRSIESSNGRAWKSPTGAKGDFQFTSDTGARFGLLTDADKRDPYKSAKAAADYAVENRGLLSQRLGRAPSAWELYVAHQQGGPGAAALLSNPNRVAGTLTIPRNLSVNAGNPNAPAGTFLNKWQTTYQNTRPDNLGEPFAPQPSGSPAPPLPPAREVGPGPAIAGVQPLSGSGGAAPGPPTPPPQNNGLLGLLMQNDPISGTDLKNYLNNPNTQQALGGLAKMGQQEQPSKPPPPLPPLPMMAMDPGMLENRPDMSTLAALLQKRRRVM